MNPRIENAILILTNDGGFYRCWKTLMENKSGDSDRVRRNTIKEYLEMAGESSLYQDARDFIRRHFEKEWPIEHFQATKQQPTQATLATTKQEENMSNIPAGIAKQSVEIKTVTYLNNVDISTLSKEQLIDAISMCEVDLERMSKLKTKSKAITDKRSAIQATIDQIVVLLDK